MRRNCLSWTLAECGCAALPAGQRGDAAGVRAPAQVGGVGGRQRRTKSWMRWTQAGSATTRSWSSLPITVCPFRGRRARFTIPESKWPFWRVGPGGSEPGTLVSALTSNADVMPTLLEAAGAAIPDRIQGESFPGRDDGRGNAFESVGLRRKDVSRALRSHSVRAHGAPQVHSQFRGAAESGDAFGLSTIRPRASR